MERSRNGPGSMQINSRCARVQFFPAHFSVSANVGIFLPIFRFERTSSRTLEFFACFRTESCHLISCHVSLRSQAGTESGRLVYGRQAESGLATRARPSGIVEGAFETSVHFGCEFEVLELEWI